MVDQLRVCIIDDEADLIDIYNCYLQDSYQVRSFLSAQEALAAFDNDYQPDLIVTDIRMPHVTGLELIDQARMRRIASPVIVISGFADRDYLMSALDRDVFGFIEKPFAPAQLKAMLQKASYKFLLDRMKNKILKQYEDLSSLHDQLLTHYRERFQTAENVIYENNIPFPKNPREVRGFLNKVHEESDLENHIETLSQRIQNMKKLYEQAYEKASQSLSEPHSA